MQLLELKVPPVALAVVFVILMWAASNIFSAASLSVPGASIAAFTFAAIGGGIAVAGVLAFRRRHTTVNPVKPETTTSIVTAGIYRITRNPMYLGHTLILIGWAMYLANFAALLVVPIFVTYMTRFQIKPEERALLAKFGSSFADYMAVVRRWI